MSKFINYVQVTNQRKAKRARGLKKFKMAVCLSHVMLRFGIKNANKYVCATPRNFLLLQCCGTKSAGLVRPYSKEAELVSDNEVDVEYEQEAQDQEAVIHQKRYKSGLKEYHRNVMQGKYVALMIGLKQNILLIFIDHG